jgi:hypothetical protein
MLVPLGIREEDLGCDCDFVQALEPPSTQYRNVYVPHVENGGPVDNSEHERGP